MTAESPVTGVEILIVDDTPANLEALTLLLESAGYRVRAASSGITAIKSFEAKSPDLVLLDVRMPGMDGYEVCRRMKTLRDGADVPIIFISAWDETEEKVEAFKAGGVDYVVKPFQEQEVLARVRTHIELRMSRKELEAWSNELASRVMERTAELENANKALQVSQQRFRAIFDQTFQFMGLLSVEGIVLAVNQTALSFVGCTEEDVLDKPFWETPWWTHSQESVDNAKQAVRLAAAGEAFRGETTHVNANGKLEIIDFSIKPMRDKDGKIIYLIPEGRPITQERRAREEQRASEERFRQVADNISEIFWLYDFAADKMLYISPAFEKVWQRPCKDVYDDINNFWRTIHPADAPKVVGNMRTGDAEFRIRRPDGEERIIRQRVFPVKDPSGSVLRVAGISSDITENVEAKKKEEVHQKQLMQADKLASVGLMAAGVAHEINNPTNLIMMNAGVMQSFWEQFRQLLMTRQDQVAGLPMGEAIEDFDELLSGISGGAERIKKIVQNMKDFARFDSGQIDDTVDINDAVESAVSLSATFIRKATDNFELRLADDLPPVKGNLQKLEQVLINLIANACQALPDRGRSICISTNFDQENRSVIIEVTDTGTGIAQEHMRQILDPFFTTKRDTGGTGLGLSVSYGIIEEHGGRLEFDSEEGAGATARVILPALQHKG